MKLRITSDSIRLRLSPTDVQLFRENGMVEETLQIGPASGQRMVYRLVRDEAAPFVAANLENNLLAVTVPSSDAIEWTGSDQVGIEGVHSSPSGSRVKILVEKDFACLTERAGHEDMDTFPNPGASQDH